MVNKKQMQLGMNPSTASGRLVKDTLWRFIVEANQDNCFQCGEKMERENFSVEHKTPWLDSDDPLFLFFDQNNISFSHLVTVTTSNTNRFANFFEFFLPVHCI